MPSESCLRSAERARVVVSGLGEAVRMTADVLYHPEMGHRTYFKQTISRTNEHVKSTKLKHIKKLNVLVYLAKNFANTTSSNKFVVKSTRKFSHVV